MGATLGIVRFCHFSSVSIRTPREGRDMELRRINDIPPVSIRTPREGRDYGHPGSCSIQQSGFNPHAPRGARHVNHRPARIFSDCFNPHAPRGARLWKDDNLFLINEFQSARPARGATRSKLKTENPKTGFNPHAPRGARPA